MSSHDNFTNRQFVFDDFVLHQDGTLFHREQQIRIPPKELAVLTLLLEAAGELVGKDVILDRVWPEGNINEESLTRCVYSLRRLLMENKSCRYIDTIYGKGFRFCRPVATVSRPTPQSSQCSIAVLPFRTHAQFDAPNLHHALVQCLSRYSPFGLTVLPATITQNCHDAADVVALIDQLIPDYYLAGQTCHHGDSWRLRVELVRAEGHHLIHHASIEVSPDQPISILQNQLVALLSQCIPGLRWNQQQFRELGSLDAAMVYLNGRHELQQHTPSSLRQALTLLRQCVGARPIHALPYCSLAECYLTLAQLGLFDQDRAFTQAQQAITKAIELDPSHPQALGLLALLSSMNMQQTVAEALFKQAWLLAPDSVDLYYYHAWHLLLSGNLPNALKALDSCLERDPSRIGASILKLWLTYFEGRLDEAIALGKRQLCQYGQNHPVLQSVLALVLAMQGEYADADSLVQTVRASGEEAGLLAINHCYIDYRHRGETAQATVQAFLAKTDSRQVRAGLLPLILAAHGKEAAVQYWRQLEADGYIWCKAWRHDPRIRDLALEALDNRVQAA
ncbi:transcriptional regulator [Burkholderia ubonensis]|uniref:HilA/EilA family virulence transcriptional regulator n=1 Tax=Burkholderia ubonensis TaxID=101571 RepID=UPI00075B993F|nr:HilA/EilA family virulence transcriptional regulator [Burkholderia ubonensis]KVP01868.1 transcriptional regulator [Burkholderia ubonensis]OJB42432.1 transcriptional regulator [Burkholderia ubonensis]OJB63827.1 transcriptional regulator [Burkholderia ubonensis]